MAIGVVPALATITQYNHRARGALSAGVLRFYWSLVVVRRLESSSESRTKSSK